MSCDISLQIQAQVGRPPITLHLISGVVVSESSLQSLLSVVLGVSESMTIVGLALHIPSIIPSTTTNDSDVIVVPLSSLANTPEYFGASSQRAQWLALYESDHYNGYYFVDVSGRPISASNDNTASSAAASAAEGRGRPLTAASSDQSSGGRRLRPTRAEGSGRPLSAVPSDKNYGGRRLRPTRAEGSGRPSTAGVKRGTVNRGGKISNFLKQRTEPIRNRFLSAEVMPLQGGDQEEKCDENKKRGGERRVAWGEDDDVRSDCTDDRYSNASSMDSSLHSMKVQLSAYGSGNDSTGDDIEEEEERERDDDGGDDDDSDNSGSNDGNSEEKNGGNYSSIPFFDTAGSITVSAWSNDKNGAKRIPRTVGMGPL